MQGTLSPGQAMYGRCGVGVAQQVADDLPLGEDVEAVGGDEPVAGELLLHAERELLEDAGGAQSGPMARMPTPPV